jgi:hypothetical protein
MMHYSTHNALRNISHRDAADLVVQGKGKYEELMVCSHEIAASTAQLVAASKVRRYFLCGDINQSNIFIKPFLHQPISQNAVQKPSLKPQTANYADVRSTVGRKNSLERPKPWKKRIQALRGGQPSSGCAGWRL